MGGGGGGGGSGGGGGNGGGGGGVGGGSGGGGGGGGGRGSGGSRGGGSGGGGGGGGGSGGGEGGGGGGGGCGAGRGSTQRSGFGGGQRQQQQRGRETLSPQQLREWYTARQRGGGFGLCTYVLHTGDRADEQCGGAHPTQRCFGRLTDAWRRQFPEATEIPRWGEQSRAGVAIYDLDFDAIHSPMYVVSISDEGDCYRCFPLDPGICEAAALGACDAAALGAGASASSGTGESALSGTASASASLTFTLDSGASRSFFWDLTFSLASLTPLSRPVAVSLADPSGGPVLSHFSTVLPCPAAPSGTLSGLYLPSFSTNLVSGADRQDGGVHQFTPACQRVTHCTEASTGRHLATFTRQPGSSLYTLTTPSPPVAESGRVAASGQVFAAASRSGPESAPCSCRLLSQETLLWHHRLGHPSLLRLRGMASRFLVSGLPRSLPPLPQGPGPTCVPCVEGRQRAAPHSSQFPPTEAPLQTLHMDVWGPARVRGQGHERYFLLVVDDYSRYTSVFPLRSKGDVTEVLIDWIRAAHLQLRQSFGSDFLVLRLHSDRGGEFSSGLLGAYCCARGIRQTFTLSDSPQQNGIAERRIGMVMDVARTSMIHAAAPHFLWPFAVRYAAHQINLHPRVSRPETSPALLWTGKVGNASAFRVWGSRAFVRDLSADKLSPRAAPCSKGIGFESKYVHFRHPSVGGCHRSTGDPHRVPQPTPPESSLPAVPDPESDGARAASPTVSRLLATVVTDPSFESTAASAQVAELVDFAAACRLDYATALVAGSESVSPPSVGGECDLGTHVLEDRQEDFESLAAAVPCFTSMLLAPEGGADAPDILTPCSYAEWYDTQRTTLVSLGFAPSSADPSLFLRTDTSLPPFYVLVYVDNLVFATADTEALTLVKSELQKRHTCTYLGELCSYLGLQITRDRARRTITLTQSHMVHQVLQRFGFQFSSPQPSPLSTGHSLSASPLDESVEPSGPYPELVGCLITSGMGLVLGGRGPVVLTCHADASWVDDSATQRSSQGYTFSLGSGSFSWRSTRSSSVLSSSCEAKIYAGAIATQELRWLTYLLIDLGEQPRSPPVLYVDIKAMIALCQEYRLEHRTKHIALRYFLAQELQQCGQLHLAYVATRANTTDIFTKALPHGDHQRFSTVLGLVPTLPHLLTA
ncbi:unnamed protein product [Closterium sp. NIES-54]